MIKTFLKNFFPPPMNAFEREISALKELLIGQQVELHNSKQESKECLQYLVNNQADELRRYMDALAEFSSTMRNEVVQLQNLLENQDKKIQQVGDICTKDLKTIHEMLCEIQKEVSLESSKLDLISAKQEEKIYYICDYEAQFIAENGFYEIRQRQDFLEKYNALVCGLDAESIATVNQILCRHMVIKGHHTGDYIDLFTPNEKAMIAAQRAGFYSDILQITPDIYACGRYLLASPGAGMGYMETTIFEDFIGFKKLRHPERVRSKDILDIGAFIGDSTVVLAQFTDKNIYAFEPGYGNFVALEKTLKMNNCENAIPIHAGIGAHSGVAKAASGVGMGVALESLAGDFSPEEETQVISVDEFVAQRGLQVGLIKVDVEGYEQEFLKGAEKTIREQKPALLLSMYHTAEDFFGLKPLLESWNVGYRFRVHKEINEHVHFDTMLIAEVLDD